MDANRLIIMATIQRVPGFFRSRVQSGVHGMCSSIRFRTVGAILLLASWVAGLAFAQGPASPPDFSGEWRRLTSHEDAHERGGGPDPGEYWGLPINDTERMRADTYSGFWVNTS